MSVGAVTVTPNYSRFQGNVTCKQFVFTHSDEMYVGGQEINIKASVSTQRISRMNSTWFTVRLKVHEEDMNNNFSTTKLKLKASVLSEWSETSSGIC